MVQLSDNIDNGLSGTTTRSTRKTRACLFGFRDEAEQETVKQSLLSLGHEMCIRPENADLILLPSGADPARAKRLAAGARIEFAENFLENLQQNLFSEQNLAANLVEAEEAIIDHGDSVTVCGIRVAKRSAAAPAGLLVDPARFRGMVFDLPFLSTLRSLFLGHANGLHVGLEGATATAKTTSVLFAAHLLGQPVRRLNLCATSDAGDLVGKFVPGAAADPIDFATLSEEDDVLHCDTRRLLARAREHGRALTDNEKRIILARENITAATWTFVEGALPKSLREGSWLLVDESNLCDAAVLERMNPALEWPPSLVLSENDGLRFGSGPGAEPVHPEYRVFTTMNPANYAGRGLLSPAFKRRFGAWLNVEAGGLTEARQFVRSLAFGTQPIVAIGTKRYRGPESAPFLPELSALPNAGGLLDALAGFHHSVAMAAQDGNGLGNQRREPYMFTRDTLRDFCGHLAKRIKSGVAPTMEVVIESIGLFYLAPLDGSADRNAVKTLLRASSLV